MWLCYLRSRLHGLACWFNSAFEYHYNLELFSRHLLGTHVVERAVFVDNMHHGRGPDQKHAILGVIEFAFKLCVEVGNNLAFQWRLTWYGNGTNSRTDNVRSVSNVTYKTVISNCVDLRKRLPILNMRQSFPSRKQTTAFLEKRRVCDLFWGLDNFAKTKPTTKHWIITPVIDWRHITKIASGHSSVVERDP